MHHAWLMSIDRPCLASSAIALHVQAQLSDAQRFQTHKTDTTVVVNGLETAAQDSKYHTHCPQAVLSICNMYILLPASRIRPISSVLSTLDDAPSESRLHNVKRAVNTVDRFRWPHALTMLDYCDTIWSQWYNLITVIQSDHSDTVWSLPFTINNTLVTIHFHAAYAWECSWDDIHTQDYLLFSMW